MRKSAPLPNGLMGVIRYCPALEKCCFAAAPESFAVAHTVNEKTVSCPMWQIRARAKILYQNRMAHFLFHNLIRMSRALSGIRHVRLCRGGLQLYSRATPCGSSAGQLALDAVDQGQAYTRATRAVAANLHHFRPT